MSSVTGPVCENPLVSMPAREASIDPQSARDPQPGSAAKNVCEAPPEVSVLACTSAPVPAPAPPALSLPATPPLGSVSLRPAPVEPPPSAVGLALAAANKGAHALEAGAKWAQAHVERAVAASDALLEKYVLDKVAAHPHLTSLAVSTAAASPIGGAAINAFRTAAQLAGKGDVDVVRGMAFYPGGVAEGVPAAVALVAKTAEVGSSLLQNAGSAAGAFIGEGAPHLVGKIAGARVEKKAHALLNQAESAVGAFTHVGTPSPDAADAARAMRKAWNEKGLAYDKAVAAVAADPGKTLGRAAGRETPAAVLTFSLVGKLAAAGERIAVEGGELAIAETGAADAVANTDIAFAVNEVAPSVELASATPTSLAELGVPQLLARALGAEVAEGLDAVAALAARARLAVGASDPALSALKEVIEAADLSLGRQAAKALVDLDTPAADAALRAVLEGGSSRGLEVVEALQVRCNPAALEILSEAAGNASVSGEVRGQAIALLGRVESTSPVGRGLVTAKDVVERLARTGVSARDRIQALTYLAREPRPAIDIFQAAANDTDASVRAMAQVYLKAAREPGVAASASPAF